MDVKVSTSLLTCRMFSRPACTNLRFLCSPSHLDGCHVTGALYNIIRVPPEKTEATETLHGAKVLCSIVPKDKSHPSYYHSFGAPASPVTSVSFTLAPPTGNISLLLPAMSENYVVFIEQPIKMDLLKIVTSKLRGKALCEGIYWDAGQDTVFHVVNKHTGEVRSSCVGRRRRRRWGRRRSHVLCLAGQWSEVPHQGLLHLPSDQRFRGGRLPDGRPVLHGRRPGHQQLPHPEPAQVGRRVRWGLRPHSDPFFQFKPAPTTLNLPFCSSRCTTPQAGLSLADSFCRFTSPARRQQDRTWTLEPPVRLRVSKLAKIRWAGGGWDGGVLQFTLTHGPLEHDSLCTGVLSARGSPWRRSLWVWRAGVPSDQLQQVQHKAIPLFLRLRLQAPGGRLAAENGPEGQNVQGARVFMHEDSVSWYWV